MVIHDEMPIEGRPPTNLMEGITRMSRMLTLQAGDVIEFADGAEITSALVLLATDASVILDRCDGSTPTVITYEELGEVRRFDPESFELAA